MKKKTVANLVMTLIIVAIVLGGCFLAFRLKAEDSIGLGSEYKITKILDNALIAEGEENRCTITIVCDTILDNLSNLNEEKAPYVPKDGVILPVTSVSFAEGDTVFDILERVCAAADIQMEYSWTPFYDTQYLEGINHLYESDCGVQSGWMYKVNEWFPNYGCSAYELKGGEEIVWCYTCNGLGADVGEVQMWED